MNRLKSNKGSATIASSVSIFLSVALMFTGVKLYQIETKAAAIQEVADASALAAEAEVAKFYTLANTADAGVFAFNLTQVSLYGAAVVAACLGNIPASGDLVSKANRVGELRNNYANSAKEALNAAQKALPISAALKASELANENASDQTSINCTAILVPLEGEELEIDLSDLEAFADDAEAKMEDVQELGEKLAEVAKELDEIKCKAYDLDCGNNPNYCLYERAKSLSILSDSQNPFYSNADAWDFNVAFLRSKEYFSKRKASEAPASFASVRERARSYLRLDYFEWVSSKIDDCYSQGKAENELYSWPNIYFDYETFKTSERYTEAIYPVTGNVMHANAALPCASGYSRLASCAEFDSGDFETCSTCEFSSQNVAKVGSATTNTESGFEHYFQEILKLKHSYDEKSEEYEELGRKTRSVVEEIASIIGDFLEASKKARIHVDPPGSDGAVAVALVDHNSESTTLNNAFVTSNLEMGQGMAISGAALKVDEAESGLSMIFDRLRGEEGIDEDAIKSAAGEEGLSASFEHETGLLSGVKNKVSSFASELIGETLESFGLEPVDLSAYKPVIVNTTDVASDDDGLFAKALVRAKEAGGFGSDLEAVVDFIKGAISGDEPFRAWE